MKRRTLLGSACVASLALASQAFASRKKHKASTSKASSKKKAKPAQSGQSHDDNDPSWQQLFDGETLTGWEPYFATPAPSVAAAAVPQNVFSVIEDGGQKLLRVSGETFGALVSSTSFSNYHLRVQWRWGDAKWPPRAHLRRSSGVIVHSLPRGAFDATKSWRPGLELELQEGSCGDLWVGQGIRVDVPSRRERFMGNPLFMYAAGYPLLTVPAADAEPRVVKSNDYEKSFGEWNVSEAIVFGPDAAFMTNGKLCMQWGNARTFLGEIETPLTEGTIQLASEGAEIHFRKISLRPLEKMPDRFRLPKKKD